MNLLDRNVKAAEKQHTTSENRAVIVEPIEEIENVSIRSQHKMLRRGRMIFVVIFQLFLSDT